MDVLYSSSDMKKSHGNQAWKEPYENKDYETALPLIREAADSGDTEAIAALAMCCIYGYGMDKDYDQGFKLAQEAADAGNARGMFLVGRCYERGDGVIQDHARALEWYQKAAELGDSWAMDNIGVMCGHPAHERRACGFRGEYRLRRPGPV